MVAVSIFVIVAFITTSTLLLIITAARTANTTRLIIDNMNFALDSISFKLKFGSNYGVGGVVSSGQEGSLIDFNDRYGNLVSYCVSDAGIYQCIGNTTHIGCGSAAGDIATSLVYREACQRLTTREITVTGLKFRLADCQSELKTDGRCPNQQVIMLVQAEAFTKGEKTTVEFQTAVSQAQSQQ